MMATSHAEEIVLSSLTTSSPSPGRIRGLLSTLNGSAPPRRQLFGREGEQVVDTSGYTGILEAASALLIEQIRVKEAAGQPVGSDESLLAAFGAARSAIYKSGRNHNTPGKPNDFFSFAKLLARSQTRARRIVESLLDSGVLPEEERTELGNIAEVLSGSRAGESSASSTGSPEPNPGVTTVAAPPSIRSPRDTFMDAIRGKLRGGARREGVELSPRLSTVAPSKAQGGRGGAHAELSRGKGVGFSSEETAKMVADTEFDVMAAIHAEVEALDWEAMVTNVKTLSVEKGPMNSRVLAEGCGVEVTQNSTVIQRLEMRSRGVIKPSAVVERVKAAASVNIRKASERLAHPLQADPGLREAMGKALAAPKKKPKGKSKAAKPKADNPAFHTEAFGRAMALAAAKAAKVKTS